MTDLKTIIVCADDFGYSPGICEGILTLVRMNRLSAVSCMVNALHFDAYVPELVSLSPPAQIGLHFNLTEGSFLSVPEPPCFSLVELLFKTHTHLISASFIERELRAQLERFIQVTGRWPDFIDGHQHVHQLPIIRTVLLQLYESQLREHGVYIRSTYPINSLPSFYLKGKVLMHTGGKALSTALKHHAIPHNEYFAGMYDFSPQRPYRDLFCQWLESAPNHTLIMCHPGEGVLDTDPIAQARLREMAYFSSEQFLEDTARYKVILRA
jgi:predicted glycoside hydrolase/deacetylase ChbG (UPF0249 family)